MSQQKETTLLVLSLLLTGAVLGGGFWWFTRNANVSSQPQSGNSPSEMTPLAPPPSPTDVTALAEPTQVPTGTRVKINGSTSMVGINEILKSRFQQKFPGTAIATNATGTEKGIAEVLNGTIDIAAISRPLTAEEQAQGLVAIPIAKDAIAIVVSLTNPFRKGLNQEQVKGIFQGTIDNWSAVGGSSDPIQVINRPPISGTRQTFQNVVLGGEPFGTTSNFKTMSRDATTPILQALGKNGISYATYVQVVNQQTVRPIAIDGLTPEAANYPYVRTLYYVYKNPISAPVKAFLGYATAPTGQEAIDEVE
ncbi:MAG: phosphate ABC transporter substrate-binding protein [Snowella sp.]|nr:phosphate ABC transporter substrate-binding protein [Snowella sp.]